MCGWEWGGSLKIFISNLQELMVISISGIIYVTLKGSMCTH